MQTSTKIDFLTFTMPESKKIQHYRLIDTTIFELRNQFLSYDTCLAVGTQKLLELHGDRNGTMIQFSGNVLNEFSETEILEIIQHYTDQGMKVKRLDIALDVREYEFNLADIERELTLGTDTRRSKKFSVVRSAKERLKDFGVTIYIGSRQSTRFMRIYDKAVERGLNSDANWKRIELELKDHDAMAMATYLINASSVSLAIRGAISDYVNFPSLTQWQEIMNCEPIHVKSDKQKVTNTRK